MKMLKSTIAALAVLAGTAGAAQADSTALVKHYGMIAITPYHVSANKHNFYRPDFSDADRLGKLDRQYSQVGSAVFDEGRATARSGASKASSYICEADTMPGLLDSPG